MKIEFVEGKNIKGYQLKGGEVVFDLDDEKHYMVGDAHDTAEGNLNLIDLKTGTVYMDCDLQYKLDKGDIKVVEAKVVIYE